MLTLRINTALTETWRSPAENGVLWCIHTDLHVKNGDFGDKTGVILDTKVLVWWQKLALVLLH